VTDTLTSRSVLVTGGNRGIGRAIVERFLADGHKVCSADMGGEAPAGALGVSCNVTDPAQVDAAFAAAEAAHGPVEIVIANAGITKDGLIMRMTDEQWDAVIDVNLKGCFYTARRAVKTMMKQRYGRVVFMGSVVGLYGNAGQVNYSSTKAALIGMARSLTREVGKRGITFNVVAPGFIETEMTAVLPTEVTDGFKAQTPAGRMGSVDDIANAVQFLTSEGAGYISGAVLPVDGGLGMGH
jgi:3-oxoacyl-[acyl-carrier protein] reductase